MEKFYLGMDIGTESVGMACTDENYNLLRAKGKDLWSVRLFDEAKDASERRMKRAARRRLQRRRQRVEFLQGIFAPFIQDQTFFIRLNNSGFYEEDKDECLTSRFSLFNDEKYTDVEFYKEYPTIFHLRAALCDGLKLDLRHYYLALHHIVKYRGHFLFEGENMGELRDIKKLFKDFNSVISEYEIEQDLYLPEDKAEEFKSLALSLKGKNDKKKEGILLFEAKNAEKKEWIALLLGATASPKKMFGEEHQEKYKEEKSISFDGLADEAFEAMAEVYGDEHFALLSAARNIYNFTIFEKVLGGNNIISKAMVSIYEKHKADLKILKEFVKQNYSQEVYHKIFRSLKEGANYVNYIGYNKKNRKKQFVDKKCKADDFYAFLKKNLPAVSGKGAEDYNKIKAEIENRSFLPKIINADNGIFPHQINGMEMDLILKNLSENYPEFAVKDEDGLTACEKIKKIFLFKIPYFVGPLNTAHSNDGKGNSWMRRCEGKTQKITPWNFDEVVDKAASNEQFIRRMTNKCTYLHNQDVLPKGSMYYQAYNTLNQINKLTINAQPISVELKKELFHNVFLKNKKVGVKQIKDYLVLTGKCTLAEAKELSIGGFDAETGLNVTMSSYKIFADKFGDMVEANPEIFEDIILWHTLNTDKGIVEEMISTKYGHIPAIKENIKWLKGLTSFKEFGRLSKKLLTELIGGIDPVTGEVYTVLNRLYNTSYNFMQLMQAFEFGKAVEEENGGGKEEITYDDVASLYVSPMVRRGIWQSLIMADEYIKAVGKIPDKIFIEVTRQDGEKKHTQSRKNKLLALYKEIGADCANINDLVKELNHDEVTDSRLRQERLYLYFLQLGRCAYTGEAINLDQLASDLYDVDHIIPQSMMKDDSIENKVLVKREKNAQKSNVYPLPSGFTNQKSFWSLLKAKGLMTDKKYARLTRISPLTEDDFREFVNRQLVITNQTAKAVAELLKAKYGEQGTKIVYSKACNVDDFKQKHKIVKCRETNDLHHARDAYLNVVVGNIFDVKFTSNYAYFYTDKEGTQRGYNLDNLYRWKIDGAWNGSSDIERIKKIVSKTSMAVTRYAYIDRGAFYKETVFGKDNKGISYPRKDAYPYNLKDENGLYKYGGYSNVQNAYFTALEFTDGKKRKKVILGVPVMIEYQANGDAEKIKEYFETVEGLKDVKILVPKIKKDTLISYNGYNAYITGAADNRITFSNGVQWFSNSETDAYVNGMSKLLKMVKEGKISASEQLAEEFDCHVNRFGKKTVVINRENNQNLYNVLLKQVSLKKYQSIAAFQTLKDVMNSKNDVFISRLVLEQVKCLFNIVGYLRRGGSNGFDLSLLNESARACSLRVGYDITKVDFAIIHQSPCGLTERVQKI